MSPDSRDRPDIDGSHARGLIVGDHGTINATYHLSDSDPAVASGLVESLGVLQRPVVVSSVSIATPHGRRDRRFPLRGRDPLVTSLTSIADGVVVLHGLAGCGKTAVALEVAENAQSQGTKVWWIDASDESQFVEGMLALAQQLAIVTDTPLVVGLPDQIWQHLVALTHPWLLIIDNADNPRILHGREPLADARGWVRPQTGQGSMLITTRDGTPSSWAHWCRLVAVGMLDSDAGAQILTDHLGAHAGSNDAASKLSERLSGLPLALRLAAAYLLETTTSLLSSPEEIISFDQFREALDAGNLALFPQVDERQSVTRIGELSLDAIASRGLPAARQVLHLLCSLGDVAVPYRELFKVAILQENALFPGIDALRLSQAIRALVNFGLVDLQDVGDGRAGPATLPTLRVHPLIREISRAQIVAGGRVAPFVELAGDLIAKAAEEVSEGPPGPQTWPALMLVSMHTFALNRTAAELSAVTRSCLTALNTATDVALTYLRRQSSLDRATAELRICVGTHVRHLGATDELTLTRRHVLAHWLTYNAKLDEALVEHQAVVEGYRLIYGAEDNRTLTVRRCTAFTLFQLQQTAAAAQECAEILEARRRTLGDSHPDTIMTRHVLAHMHEDEAGESSTATLREHSDILDTSISALGGSDRHTIDIRTCLATTQEKAGQPDEAVEQYRLAWTALARARGVADADAVSHRWALIELLRRIGRDDQARTVAADMTTELVDAVGERHPTVLDIRIRVSTSLLNHQPAPERAALLSTLLDDCVAVLGPSEPRTLRTLAELASACYAAGDFTSAVAHNRTLLARWRQVPDADAASIVVVWRNLGQTLDADGQFEEAERELRAVLAAQLETSDEDATSVALTRYYLGNTLRRRGQRTEAIELLRATVSSYRAVDSSTTSDITIAWRALGITLDGDGQLDAAEGEFRRLLDFQLAAGLDADASTALTRYHLASVLSRQDKPPEAIKHLREALQTYQTADPSTADALDVQALLALNHRLLARMLQRLSQHAEAIEHLRTALSIHRAADAAADEAATWLSLAQALARSGNDLAAEHEYRALLTAQLETGGEGDTSVALTRYHLGTTLRKLGQRTEAIELLRAAVSGFRAADPSTAADVIRAWRALGITIERDGQLDAAEEEYRQLLDFQFAAGLAADRSTALTRYQLAGVLRMQHKPHEAIDQLRTALSMYQSVNATADAAKVGLGLVRVLRESGDYAAAERQCTDLTSRHPDPGSIASNRAVADTHAELLGILHEQGRHEDALAAARSATAYATAAFGDAHLTTTLARQFLIHEACHCGAATEAASEASALIAFAAGPDAPPAWPLNNSSILLQVAAELHDISEFELAARAAEVAAKAREGAHGPDDDRTRDATERARHNREHLQGSTRQSSGGGVVDDVPGGDEPAVG